jgi:flavin-dependent dehydrogenase
MRTVIVGAGVSGLACAISAALNGAEVVVMDKKRRIGEPIHGTGGIAKQFILEYGVTPVEDFMYGLNRAYIMSPNAEYTVSINNQTIGYVMDQGKFEEYLANEAEKAGAEIWLEKYVTPDMVGELRRKYDVVVGADGAYSTVRRYLHIPDNDDWDMHRALEFWVVGTPNFMLDNSFLMYFDKRIAPYGYVWLFKYKDIVKYGMGVPVSLNIDISSTLVMNFDRFFKDRKIINCVGGVVPTPPPLPKVVYDNVALVGDAGNFVNAATGAGIHGALMSGKYCGIAIGEKSLNKYEEWYESTAWPMLRAWYKIKRFVYSLDNEDFDRLLKAFKDFRIESINPRFEIPRAVKHVAFKDAKLFIKLMLTWMLT